MSRILRLSPLAALAALATGAVLPLTGCGRNPAAPPFQPPAATATASATASATARSSESREQFSRLVERYWDEHTPADALLSPQSLADALSVERRYLAELALLPRAQLDASAQQTFDIFKRQREAAIEGFTFPAELMPMDPFGGPLLDFAEASAGTRVHPLLTVAEYDSWLQRLRSHTAWTLQAVENMREGLRRGYTTPKPVVARMLPLLQRLALNDAGNIFYAPLRSMPDSIKDPDRTRLTQTLNREIASRLLPANRALLEFLQRDYLPHARSSLALTALPLGSAWYAFRLRQATGSSLAAADIHRMGLAEVERLHPKLENATSASALNAAGTGTADLLEAYRALAVEVRAAMPNLFAESPQADFDIRSAVFDDLLRGTLSYLTAAGHDRPAVLFVRTTLPAAVSVPEFLQVAEPGRHYLTALQQGTTLPRFRRETFDPAFLAGWQMYAASLGEELGLYTEESAKQAWWTLELRCAAALVVDTGIHALGWNQAQSLDYLRTQLNLADTEAQTLIDLYTARPADALGCKLGQLTFQALRSRAQQALGGRFDIRDFHSQILENGAMPLDILETQVKAWLEAAR